MAAALPPYSLAAPQWMGINAMTLRLNYVATVPDGMKALGALYTYVQNCGLPKSIIELVFLRSSQINCCAYCIDSHTRELLATGMLAEKVTLVAVWAECDDLFDARERAALAWAETVTRVSETHVEHDAFETAREVFSEKELADLTLAIGLINTYNRLGVSFRAVPRAVKHAHRPAMAEAVAS